MGLNQPTIIRDNTCLNQMLYSLRSIPFIAQLHSYNYTYIHTHTFILFHTERPFLSVSTATPLCTVAHYDGHCEEVNEVQD